MKIGLISYHFQNSTSEGIVTARLASALADAGHYVVVLTSHARPLHEQPTRREPSPNLIVERVNGDESSAPFWWRSAAARAIGSRIWDKFVAIPNLYYACSASEWGWIGQVTRRFVEISQREGPFHVLHSRLNPHVSHLAALQVTKTIPSCPWCAYFSDPWPHSLYPDSYRFTVGPVSRVRLEAVLNAMIARADSLVFPADRLKTHLLNGRREAARDKAFVAPHLSRSHAAVAVRQTRPHLVIRHAGFLMKERRIDTVFAALRRLRSCRPEVYRTLRVEFAGRYVNDTTPLPPADLRYVVRFFPSMNTEALPEWLAEADVLLLVEAKMREGIFFPAKLAEYLGFRRPILALSPPVGTISDLLSDSGTMIVEPDDEARIAEALCTLSDEWRSGALPFRTPTNRHRWMVSAGAVVPIYEQAFDAAATRRRAASASS